MEDSPKQGECRRGYARGLYMHVAECARKTRVYLSRSGVYDGIRMMGEHSTSTELAVMTKGFTTARPLASPCAFSPEISSCQSWFQSAALLTKHPDRWPSWCFSSCSYKRPLVHLSAKNYFRLAQELLTRSLQEHSPSRKYPALTPTHSVPQVI